MPDLRRRLRSWDLPGRDDITGRTLAGWLSRVLFILLLIALVSVSLSADIVAIAVLASVVLSQFLYIVLPVQKIRGFGRRLFTGEAGEEAYESATDRVDDTSGWFR